MAKKELLVDLRIAQPGAPGVSTMPGHYYSVIFDGSTRQDEAIAITVRFANEQWEIIQRLVRIGIVAKFVAGTQLSQVLRESLFTDLASRKASNGYDHRWCSNKQSSSPQPGSVNAADDQMDKGCCVPPKKPPFLAVHNTPLLDRITSAFRTRTIKDICADQDVCRMFKQSKKL